MIEEEFLVNEKIVQDENNFYPNIYLFKVKIKTLRKIVKYVQCSICGSATIHKN